MVGKKENAENLLKKSRQLFLKIKKQSIMKKAKIFMGLGATVLAVCGFFATKANSKFAFNGSGVFDSGSSSLGTFDNLSTATFTTTASGNFKVQLRTVSGGILATLATSQD